MTNFWKRWPNKHPEYPHPKSSTEPTNIRNRLTGSQHLFARRASKEVLSKILFISGIVFLSIYCIFAVKELKRGPEGGLSLSTKSRHLPLRKQFRHDSPGKSYRQSLWRLLCFYGCTSIAVIQYCTFDQSSDSLLSYKLMPERWRRS